MKYTLISVIILLLVSSFIPGCLNEDEDEVIDIHYELEINPERSVNYTVYLPTPLISRDDNPREGEPIKLMGELEIFKGNATWQTIVIEKGHALKIVSDEHIIIKGHKKLKNPTSEKESDYLFNTLSMECNEEENYKLYYNTTNDSSKIQVSLHIYNKRVHPNGMSEYVWNLDNHNISSGWQDVEFSVNKKISDQK